MMISEDDTVLLLASTACLLSCLRENVAINQRKRKCKRFGVHPILLQRKNQGFYNNLMKEMRLHDHYMFYNFTRMSPASFDRLLSLIGIFITKKSIREPISPGCRLAITLRHLATGDSYPSLSYAFRVGTSTICNIIQETCKVLWDVLVPIVLPIPTEDMMAKYAEDFAAKWSLPNCIGAIDGKHVNIEAPSNSGSSYFNYKKTHSIVLLGICDGDYFFTYVDIGAYGSQSDCGILNKSTFGQRLMKNELNIPPPKCLPYAASDTEIPHFFVADEAFPLRINLMRPYSKPRSGNMPQDEIIFNYRLSRARRIIENVFGILVARFRIFHRTIKASPTTVDGIIKACVCLHNFIRKENHDLYFRPEDVDRETDGQILPGRWRREIPEQGISLNILQARLGARNASHTAVSMRNYLKEYVCGPGACLAPWQWEVINKTN